MSLNKDDIRKSPYNLPTIVAYNRLEASPRSSDYQRSLPVEIRDPLWMLARQWQVGEFESEDGGSIFNVKVHSNRQQLDATFEGEQLLRGGTGVPLEYAVEQERRTWDLPFRLEAGKLFRSLLCESPALEKTWLPACRKRYALSRTLSPDQLQSDKIALNLYEALKEQALDGVAIYQNITQISSDGFVDWVNGLIVSTSMNLDQIEEALAIGKAYELAFRQFYGELPTENHPAPLAWVHDRMEYKFEVANERNTPGETKLSAKQYAQGNLDWHAFDLETLPEQLNPAHDQVNTYFPGPVNFLGTARGRWWDMEDQAINFGKISARKTDLLTMLMIDFALIYGNDWLLLPLQMEVNSLCKIKSITVKDVFGFETTIEAADTIEVSSWEKWSMFSLGQNNKRDKHESLFYLTPALLKSLHSEPIEQVHFRRDEMANLVWAFEQKIPGPLGMGIHTYETEINEAPEPEAASTPPRYILGTEVPSYQIPFISVQLTNNTAQTRLQRARMPTGRAPNSAILTEVPTPFYLQEEEIPREGVTVLRRWQRTRWVNGQTFVWIGREKEVGNGEMRSGLAFDQVK